MRSRPPACLWALTLLPTALPLPALCAVCGPSVLAKLNDLKSLLGRMLFSGTAMEKEVCVRSSYLHVLLASEVAGGGQMARCGAPDTPLHGQALRVHVFVKGQPGIPADGRSKRPNVFMHATFCVKKASHACIQSAASCALRDVWLPRP
jgi:hypothetical protein